MTGFATTLLATTRSLLAAGGALQSTAAGDQVDELTLKEALNTHFNPLGLTEPLAFDTATSDVVREANSAFLKAGSGEESKLTDAEIGSLEVIVQVIGRPALRYVDANVQPPTTETAQNQRWHVFVVTARKRIDAASASVARLNLQRSDGREEVLGTAWRLGDDLLVTNRHVVRRLVLDSTLPATQWKLDPGRGSIADFTMTDASTSSQRLLISSLEFCAEEPTVDVAVLRLKPSSTGIPDALSVDFTSASLGQTITSDAAPPRFEGEEVYVVGHPLQRLPTTETLKVFDDANGLKRCSPGRTTAIRQGIPIVEHDCSTLGGNSGSAVITVREHRVVGIHMGGHGTNAARTTGIANDAVAFAMLGAHRLTGILTSGRV